MARPNAPHHRKKGRVVIFRATQSQFARLEFNAAAVSLPVNHVARERVFGRSVSPVIRIVPVVDPVLIKELHFAGHNLNQLVKNSHIFGRVSPKVEELCTRINRLIDRVVGEETD
jgi:hypothetical protein